MNGETKPRPRRTLAAAYLDTEDMRVCDQLRIVIRQQCISQRTIEDRIGLTRGYLSQILGGHVSLRYGHVLAILHAIDMAPSAFFARLYISPERTGIHLGGDAYPPLSAAEENARINEAFETLDARVLHFSRMLDVIRTRDTWPHGLEDAVQLES
ncbi:MAG: helix-turn-helix transcriptional regulator [Acidobacteriota bacterium]